MALSTCEGLSSRAVTGCGETDGWGPEVPIALFSEDGGTPELESSSGQGNP
jgi:hypothetical protein